MTNTMKRAIEYLVKKYHISQDEIEIIEISAGVEYMQGKIDQLEKGMETV